MTNMSLRDPLGSEPSPISTGRRDALALAAGLAVSATLILPGCARGKEGGEKEVTANEDLMREHGVLRRILIVYREIAPKILADPAKIDAGAVAQAATLFRDFGERYHEQMLEEQHIFPLVRKAGGAGAALIDPLLAQHARGREITAYVLDRTKTGVIGSGDGEAMARALTAFSRMYEAHAAREDTVVFPAFKASLSEEALDELGEQFEDIEHRQFGGDGFDIAVDKIATIERRLGVADLASFTAPKPS